MLWVMWLSPWILDSWLVYDWWSNVCEVHVDKIGTSPSLPEKKIHYICFLQITILIVGNLICYKFMFNLNKLKFYFSVTWATTGPILNASSENPLVLTVIVTVSSLDASYSEASVLMRGKNISYQGVGDASLRGVGAGGEFYYSLSTLLECVSKICSFSLNCTNIRINSLIRNIFDWVTRSFSKFDTAKINLCFYQPKLCVFLICGYFSDFLGGFIYTITQLLT